MIKKFRIYDKLENEYCEEPDYRWTLSRNGVLYNSENDKYYYDDETYIIEFSSGIYDNNKNELFDGDICEVIYYNHASPDYKVIQYISFEKGSFTLNSYNNDAELDDNFRNKCPLFYCYAPNKIKKIGNIHQNYDFLLK